ncbi:hypothetical protein ACEV8G_03020 [Vibrio parahaemolyticus]|uniref:hypothetical protein n=1 Tax=Vibrio parahaemolyticus TaxID=670 RepID=UPI00249047BD|nr:hypothetical protein [Vibrio parahaemolyticus]ELB2958139.1 hypothetical protein [Vibrio parahaemolyticus]MDG3430280.1 hypothetical protein [Vibrio parahaemolyticus]
MNKEITISLIAIGLTACGTTRPPILESDAWKQVNNIREDGQYDQDKITSIFNGKRCITSSHKNEKLLLAHTSFKNAKVALEEASLKLEYASMEVKLASENNLKLNNSFNEVAKITDTTKRDAKLKEIKSNLDNAELELKSAGQNFTEANKKFVAATKSLDTAKTSYEQVNSVKPGIQELEHNDLCKAYSFADFYRQKYIELSSDAYLLGTGLDALGLLAGLTGVTAVAFDWHQDALIGSALTLATATGAKSYTQPGQRSNLYLQGAQRMQCIVNTSPRVLNSRIDYNQLVGMKREVYESIRKINLVPLSTIESARNTTADTSLTKEKIEQHISTFLELKKNSSEIKNQITKSISLVESMPDQIILATKEAELKFNSSFVSSAPDFNKSLSIIQGAISQQMLNQQQIQRLEALFPEKVLLPEPKKTEKSSSRTSYDNLSELVNLSNELLDKRETLMSELVNFTDVNAALKLCNAI